MTEHDRDQEITRLRREIEELRGQVFIIGGKMDQVLAMKTDFAVMQRDMVDLRGNGKAGRVGALEGDIKRHAYLISIATGAIGVVTPITFWLLNQYHLAAR